MNCLERLGRWVFCGCENSQFKIFDLNQQNSVTPVTEYTYPVSGAIKSIVIESNNIYMAIRPMGRKVDPSTIPKPQIVSWSPQLEGFDFFSMMNNIIINRNVNTRIIPLYYSCTKILNTMNDISVAKKEVN